MTHGILIADDHPLYRAALADLIGRSGDLSLVGAVSSLEEAVELLARPATVCDLVILDLNMPGMDGLAGIASIQAVAPDCRIALISGNLKGEVVAAALALGATGFLPKSFDGEVILAAIRLILTGAIYVPHDLSGGPVASARPSTLVGGRPNEESDVLTAREQAVLDRMVRGETYKEIGRALGIAEITVKLHARRITMKLGAKNRATAIATAVRRGIVTGG